MEAKHWTDYISCIIGIIGIIPVLIGFFYWLYKKITYPRLTYGELDYPSAYSAHYYLLIKSFDSEE